MIHKASITADDGTVHHGQRLDTVARRVWGPGARVVCESGRQWSEDDGSWWAGEVTIVKVNRTGTRVLAQGVGRVKL